MDKPVTYQEKLDWLRSVLGLWKNPIDDESVWIIRENREELFTVGWTDSGGQPVITEIGVERAFQISYDIQNGYTRTKVFRRYIPTVTPQLNIDIRQAEFFMAWCEAR